jgi:ATP-dependent Clp protease ATP-binding subunit ClpX
MPTDTAVLRRCSFCGKDGANIGRLIESAADIIPICHICEGCVQSSVSVLVNDNKSAKKKKRPSRNGNKSSAVFSPRELVQHLDRYVVGQDSCKKLLAVEVCKHYDRIREIDRRGSGDSLAKGDYDDVEIEKNNIVLIGPTGSGKTLLAKSLAKMLDVPFAIGDATTLTEAGYVGEDVENLILKLLQAADFDVQRAQQGIIYIDEIDKLRSTGGNVSITRDVSGQGVQQSLLKLIEGTVANVPPQGGRKHPEQQYIQIDTTNILFICGGSFVGIEDIIKKRLNKGGMGFHSTGGRESGEYNEVLSEVTSDDLEEFGLIPELVGRLPVVAPLEELSIESLREILVGPKNALLRQEKKLFSLRGVSLEFTPDAIDAIAEIAIKKKTGARALRSVVCEVMNEIYYLIDDKKNSAVVVDELAVRNRKLSRIPSTRSEAA